MATEELTDDLFLDVFDQAPERSLQPGDVLIHEGEPAEEVFNIVDGMLMVSRQGRDGRRQVLSFLFPDNFVGLTATKRYFFTVEAVIPSRVVSRPREALDRRLAADNDADRAFIAMVFRVLENLVDLAYSLGQRTARERLAVFVLYLRHRYRLSAGITDDDDPQLAEVALPMSRSDIADFLGLKKETVSRSFTQLEQQGLIERLGSDRVRVLDLHGLRELAGVLDFASPLRLPPARNANTPL
jgi:CRP/FNR family transcriptional regulator